MDFFEHQARARRKTAQILVFYTIAVAALVGVMYVLIAAVVNMTEAFAFVRSPAAFGGAEWSAVWWRPMLLTKVAVGTAVVLGAAAAWKIHALSSGGISVASSLGGRWVPPETQNAQERRLLNVVEEIAIASGVPVPAVFILEGQDGINAFAAGNTPSDAAIAVTGGALRLLDREQLQGVVAHEFSHIVNGDMRVSLRIVGLLFGFLMLSTGGRALFSGSARYARNPAPIALAIGLMIIGWIGLVLGRLVKAAVSRQREYLADASAVQFTRSLGLARALRAIGGYSPGSRVTSWMAEEMSHLFFANALGFWAYGVFDTHPPLRERIRRIDPSFDGTFPRVALPEPARAIVDERPLVTPAAAGAAPIAAPLATTMEIKPEEVMARVGNPTPEHLEHGAQLLALVPSTLREAVREPLDAVAALYALLLHEDEAVRAQQLEDLRAKCPAALLRQVERLQPDVHKLDGRARLPLADLALPAVRRLSAPQYQHMILDLQALADVRDPPGVFGFALQRILRRRVEPAILYKRPRATQFYSAKPLLGDLSVLLSSLAHVARVDTENAFKAGVAALPPHARRISLLPAEECTFAAVDRALERIAQSSGTLRRSFLDACAHCALADNKVTLAEAELLRAVAEALECPLPPFLPSAKAATEAGGASGNG